MARPITWRNVAAPDFSGAANILDQAATQFNSGFDGLAAVTSSLENRRNAAIDEQKLDAANAFRASILQQYGNDLAGLRAASQDGTIDQLVQQQGGREQFGDHLNLFSADAFDNLISNRQDQIQADQQHRDFQTNLAGRDYRAQVQELINQGQFAKAREVLDNNVASVDESPLYAAIQRTEDAAKARTREQEAYDFEKSERDRTLGIRQGNEDLLRDGLEHAQTYTQLRKDTLAEATDYLARHGVTEEDLEADPSQLPEAEQQRLGNIRNGLQAILNKANASDFRKNFQEQIIAQQLENPALNGNAALAQFDAVLEGRRATPEYVTAATKQKEAELKALPVNRQNSFIQSESSDMTPSDRFNRVITELGDRLDQQENSRINRKNAREYIHKLATKGYEGKVVIDGKVKTVEVPLPVDMLLAGINAVGTNWSNNDLGNYFDDLLKGDGFTELYRQHQAAKRYREQLSAYKRQIQEESDLEGTRLSDLNDLAHREFSSNASEPEITTAPALSSGDSEGLITPRVAVDIASGVVGLPPLASSVLLAKDLAPLFLSDGPSQEEGEAIREKERRDRLRNSIRTGR